MKNIQISANAIEPQRRSTSVRSTKSDGVASIWALKNQRMSALTNLILSYIGGFILRQWNKKIKCSVCRSILRNNNNESKNVNVFLKHKNYKNAFRGLQTISNEVLACLTTLEAIFMDYQRDYLRKSRILSKYLFLTTFVAFPQCTCHPQVKEFFFRSFFRLRLQHQCRLMTRRMRQNGMKMQTKGRTFTTLTKRL